MLQDYAARNLHVGNYNLAMAGHPESLERRITKLIACMRAAERAEAAGVDRQATIERLRAQAQGIRAELIAAGYYRQVMKKAA
mgnify:FL=1